MRVGDDSHAARLERASMRPGQTAPECPLHRSFLAAQSASFNEAGADCPGMRDGCVVPAVARLRFNEAGADCPGMPVFEGHVVRERAFASMRPGQTAPECSRPRYVLLCSRAGFNEAGADCPGMPVRLRLRCCALAAASMRPGQTAPECEPDRGDQTGGSGSFNEAGADCPGMHKDNIIWISEKVRLQ